MKVNTYQ